MFGWKYSPQLQLTKGQDGSAYWHQIIAYALLTFFFFLLTNVIVILYKKQYYIHIIIIVKQK